MMYNMAKPGGGGVTTVDSCQEQKSETTVGTGSSGSTGQLQIRKGQGDVLFSLETCTGKILGDQ